MLSRVDTSLKLRIFIILYMVSIITPCYNSSAFIRQTIESVLNQSYSNWELIIIDDCSNDNSESIILKYVKLDSRIKYLKTDKSSGSPVEPRNIGIKNAIGRYIAFLDSDDLWLSTKLEEQLKLFDNKYVAVVYSNYEKINEDGKRESRIVIATEETNYKSLLKSNVIGNLTGIYDTSKVGKVYCSNIKHEDYVLWLSILKKGFIAKNTNTVTALYRVRNNSVSSNKLKALTWQWNILRNVEKLPLYKSIYYYAYYAITALRKVLK